MPLDRGNIKAGQRLRTRWLTDLYDLLSGQITDTDVTLGRNLIVHGALSTVGSVVQVAPGPGDVPFGIIGAPGQFADLFTVRDSAGNLLFSINAGGTVVQPRIADYTLAQHSHQSPVQAGVLQTAALADGAITTPKIAANAVTVVAWQQIGNLTTSSTSYVDISGTITVPVIGGLPLIVIFTGVVKTNTSGSRAQIAVKYNGVSNFGSRTEFTAGGPFLGIATVWRLTSVAGVTQITPQIKSFDPGGSVSIDDTSWLFAMELRR